MLQPENVVSTRNIGRPGNGQLSQHGTTFYRCYYYSCCCCLVFCGAPEEQFNGDKQELFISVVMHSFNLCNEGGGDELPEGDLPIFEDQQNKSELYANSECQMQKFA